MIASTRRAAWGRRCCAVLGNGLVVLAGVAMQPGASFAAGPDAAHDLLNRHVLESLSHAVQPTPTSVNPMRDHRVWSRRAIIEQLDQRAIAATRSVSLQKHEEPLPITRPEKATVAPTVPPARPVQPLPLTPPVNAESLQPHANVPAALPPVRELAPMSPLRGASTPVDTQQPALLRPENSQPPANTPAQVIVPAVSEPARSNDNGRDVERTSWNRPALLPVASQTQPTTAGVNPLRTPPAGAGQSAALDNRANPLRR